MKIIKLKEAQKHEALALALQVFMEFEAPDYNSEGIANFFIKIIDSIVMAAILTPGVYYFLQWIQHRG